MTELPLQQAAVAQQPVMDRGAAPRTRSGWRPSLVLALAGTVAAPLALFAASAWVSWNEAWRVAQVEAERTAEAAAHYAQRLLEAQLLRIARTNDILAGLTDAEVRAREAEVHDALRAVAAERQPADREAFYVFVYDRDSAPLVASNLLPVPPPAPVLATRDFNRALRPEDRPWIHVSQLYVGSTTGRPFFAVTGRRERTGNPLPPGGYDGVINASVYADNVNRALAALAPPGDLVSLVRADGYVLARSPGFGSRSPAGLRVAADSPTLPVMVSGMERGGLLAAFSVDGIERLVAFRKVAGDWPVYAFAGRERAVIGAAWRRALLPQAALAAGSSALLLLLALAVMRRQRALRQANVALERRVEERTRDLRDRERLLRLSQSAAGAGSWSWEPDSGAVRWSPEMFHLLGLDPEADAAREGFEPFMDLVHPADRRPLRDALEEALRSGALSIEFRVFRRRPDGAAEERWLLARARLFPAQDRMPRTLIGIDMDITERRRAAERFEVASAAMSGFVYEWEVRTGHVDRTAGCLALIGEEVEPTLEAWHARIHPEDLPRVIAEGEALAADPARETYAIEYRVRRKDGGWVWLLDRGRVTRDPATGAILRLLGGSVDITAHKLAEEQQALLLREVDHRARNALAVVKAALRLTPRRDVQSFGAAVEGRIDALARAQALLSATSWSGTDLRELLEGALAPFLVPGAAPHAVLEGPEVMLAAAATQPMAMAVHELATNATKYGALSVRSGVLRVTWRRERDSLRLTWQEEGGPSAPSQPPTRKGFGSRVVTATIESQLGGEAAWAWSEAGLRLDVTLPAGRVIASESAVAEPAVG